MRRVIWMLWKQILELYRSARTVSMIHTYTERKNDEDGERARQKEREGKHKATRIYLLILVKRFDETDMSHMIRWLYGNSMKFMLFLYVCALLSSFMCVFVVLLFSLTHWINNKKKTMRFLILHDMTDRM